MPNRQLLSADAGPYPPDGVALTNIRSELRCLTYKKINSRFSDYIKIINYKFKYPIIK